MGLMGQSAALSGHNLDSGGIAFLYWGGVLLLEGGWVAVVVRLRRGRGVLGRAAPAESSAFSFLAHADLPLLLSGLLKIIRDILRKYCYDYRDIHYRTRSGN